MEIPLILRQELKINVTHSKYLLFAYYFITISYTKQTYTHSNTISRQYLRNLIVQNKI